MVKSIIREFRYGSLHLRHAIEIASSSDEEKLTAALDRIRGEVETRDMSSQEFRAMVKANLTESGLKLIKL